MLQTLASWDQAITLWVNRSAQTPAVQSLMELLSRNSTWNIVGLCVFFILLLKNRRLAIFSALVVLVGVGISAATSTYLLKPFFERLRPCHSLPQHISAIVGCGGLYSFPSNHAANAMTIALLLWRLFGKSIGLLAVGTAMLVGLSRVHLGAHFVGDILLNIRKL